MVALSERSASDKRRTPTPDSVCPTLPEVAGLALMTLVYVLAWTIFGDVDQPVMSVVGPAALILILGTANLHMVMRDPLAIWTALFWCRNTILTYFGLGGLLLLLVTEETRLLIDRYYQPLEGGHFRLNVLIAYGTFAIIGSAHVVSRLFPWAPPGLPAVARRGGSSSRELRNPQLFLTLGIAFYAMGMLATWFFTLPFKLGFTQSAPPGVLSVMSALVPGGLFMLLSWCLEHRRSYVPLVLVGAAVPILTSFLVFEKSTLMLTLIVVCLAYMWRRITLTRVAISLAVVAGVYLSIVPIVNYSRAMIYYQFDTASGISVEHRFQIMSGYFDQQITLERDEKVQYGLARLVYHGPGTFAMFLRDSNVESNTLDLFWVALVPRFVWPDKPIITQPSKDFNVLATGNDQSASAPGLIAESYWNFGWWGPLICLVPFGAVLIAVSRFTVDVMAQGRWIFFPIVMLALRMGYRSDGLLVQDVVGPCGQIVLLYLLLRSVEIVFTARRADRSPIRAGHAA